MPVPKVNPSALALLTLLCLPFFVRAVSYYPDDEYFYSGARVCLFRSGTAEIRGAIQMQDTLTVFRSDRRGKTDKVGKSVVISYRGDDYLQARVIEGALLIGDVARKGEIACLLISAGSRVNDE